jgi:hypothetical protein
MTAVDQSAAESSAMKTVGNSGLTPFTLALNYLPFAQLLLGGVLVWTIAGSPATAALLSFAWLFLVPPAMCRLAFALYGKPSGESLRQDSRAYKVWWFTHQWQALFNRLSWIEEVLRLVPGVYSLWLNLWGGNVSTMVYWSPGCIVIDRPLVIVEPFAVIGGHSGIAGHLGRIADDGLYVVDIAAPRVGCGAIMGAGSALGPGSVLEAGRMLPAGRILAPFARWDRIVRQRPPTDRPDNADG